MSSRILVTRAPHQASALAQAIDELGMEPVLIPTIELAEPTTFEPIDVAIGRLRRRDQVGFHWTLFTSVNAVEALFRRLKEATNGFSLVESSCRIAAIGPATARSLEGRGVHVDLLPTQAVAESFVESLLPYAVQADGSATRFLLVRAEQARDVLPDRLRAAGADVTIAPVYRTIIPQASLASIQSLFRDPEKYPDAITFTSSSTVSNLLALMEIAKLTLPSDVLRISIGPITSQTLREHNLPPHAEASEPTIVALAETVLRSVQAKGQL